MVKVDEDVADEFALSANAGLALDFEGSVEYVLAEYSLLDEYFANALPVILQGLRGFGDSGELFSKFGGRGHMRFA